MPKDDSGYRKLEEVGQKYYIISTLLNAIIIFTECLVCTRLNNVPALKGLSAYYRKWTHKHLIVIKESTFIIEAKQVW